MQRGATFLRSSIGQKVVMAVTGLVLYGFVIGHMVGNLQVYLGPRAINAYGEFLREFLHGQGIWIARLTLLLAVGLHIWAAVVLTLSNWAARPRGYRVWEPRESTYASRTMVWSGPIIALFVVYHLAHFTWGTAHPDFVQGDVFHNVVVGFQNPFVSAFYVLAMLALGLHMYHGFFSLLNTLGVSHARKPAVREATALALAAVVVAGNISIPVAVMAGLVHP
ncbi:MAG TPA: succinate dehydrogenase cytochrome b subunit [Vicinamibacteria bacterium]|nr:succinate dehydrogenase cytochrome b subunit [Vicinamibacteria bacterium]